MEFKQSIADARGTRISVLKDGIEVGRAYIYLMHNDLHDQPFALLEDVYIEAAVRGQGIGSQLVKEAIALAQRENCYKLIATSRISKPKVHELYQRLGFTQHGVEFRIDF